MFLWPLGKGWGQYDRSDYTLRGSPIYSTDRACVRSYLVKLNILELHTSEKSSLLTRGKVYSSYFSSFKITNFAKVHHGKTSGINSLDFQLGRSTGNQSLRVTFLALEDVTGQAGCGEEAGGTLCNPAIGCIHFGPSYLFRYFCP